MKFISLILIIVSFFTSCSKKPVIDLNNLNGYWEIDRVVISDESQKQGQDPEKNYNFNRSVEYFVTKDSVGFRSKVSPGFNGKIQSNAQKLNYTISYQKGKYIVTYNTPTSKWSEELIEASPEQICIANQRGDHYYYRKFTPITIDEKE